MVNWWDHLNTIIGSIALAVVGAVIWLFRQVLTNQRKIELLENEIQTRVELRAGVDDDVHEQLKEIKQDIKHILDRTHALLPY